MTIRRAQAKPAGSSISLTVNGKQEELITPTRLTDYLHTRIEKGRMVAIGYNGEVVHRDHWTDVVLKQGDVLDVVHMVGGG